MVIAVFWVDLWWDVWIIRIILEVPKQANKYRIGGREGEGWSKEGPATVQERGDKVWPRQLLWGCRERLVYQKGFGAGLVTKWKWGEAEIIWTVTSWFKQLSGQSISHWDREYKREGRFVELRGQLARVPSSGLAEFEVHMCTHHRCSRAEHRGMRRLLTVWITELHRLSWDPC